MLGGVLFFVVALVCFLLRYSSSVRATTTKKRYFIKNYDRPEYFPMWSYFALFSIVFSPASCHISVRESSASKAECAVWKKQ